MFLKNDYFVYEDPSSLEPRIIRGSVSNISGYSNGELFIHEFGDGTRDLVWVDGSGTARRMPSAYVNSISASSQPDNSIWRDSGTNALAWKAGGQAYSILGDTNSVGNISGLTLSTTPQGVQVEFDTDIKRFLPQEFRLFRSDDGGLQTNNDLGLIADGHVDDTVTDGGEYRYKVEETVTLLYGSTELSTTQTKSITWNDPGPGSPATSAPTNISVDFGSALTGPYPVEVFWDNTASGYDTFIQIAKQDNYGDPWDPVISAAVEDGQGTSYNSETDSGQTFSASELGTRVKATLYYTHPDGNGPTATVYQSSPSDYGL
jgi:hypothetical protein